MREEIRIIRINRVNMSRLFRSSSSVISMSTLSSIPKIINYEKHSYENVNIETGDCNISKVSPSEIYKSSFLNSFKSYYNVKTVENVYAINKERENYSLLTI